MTGIFNSDEILNKLTNKILAQGERHVLINGPEWSGKSTLVNSFCDKFKQEGWNVISFNPEQFDFSKDLFEQFITIILMGIRRKVGQKEFLNFLKSRNLKNIVRKKIKTNNRAVAFRYFFNQKQINDDIDKNELLNIQTLIEINNALKRLQIDLLIVFNDFEKTDLVSDLNEYRVIRKIKKYLTEARMITTFNFPDIENLSTASKFNLEKTFDGVIDLYKEKLMFTHPNTQVNYFIKRMDIKNLFLINSINESMELPEKWLKRNLKIPDTYENRILYYEEIYFVVWFLQYLRLNNDKLFNIMQEDIKLYDGIRKNKYSQEELEDNNNLGNIKYINLLLKTRGYKFEGEYKFYEILKLINTPLKWENPIIVTVESKPNVLNIINEYAFMFIFNCVLSNVENIIENKNSETLLINFEHNQKELKTFASCLYPRTLKQINTSKEKEIYDLSVFEMVKELIEKL
ncbi:ATP-binding protein [Spiroplasma monobiae]|uniref:KAP NTPase domain-containing protein n=1 Tax=Spiroplasma monobiae MQ-1 TaxID=1336748 RepID=A0A2K9LU97_SPISQ|nr:ATP-binding protein [Spiroplasma monobiae]AUM62622.1 hypothetical protein SMONO_v1c03730 [Spiroplasma monobiae MQ-1]